MIPRTVTTHAVALVIGGLIVAIGCAWIQYRPSLPSVLATPAKELAKEETKTLKDKPVVVYREKVKAKLGLPESVKKDATKHVVNSTQVESSDRPTTVTAVYDDQTGVVDLFKRQDRLPWLAFDRRAAIGVAYGVKNDANGFVARIYGRADLIQIKRLHAGLLADVDNAGGWYGGGFAELRW